MIKICSSWIPSLLGDCACNKFRSQFSVTFSGTLSVTDTSSFRRSFRSHTFFGQQVFSVTHSFFSVTRLAVTDSVRSQDFRSQTVLGVLSVTDSLRSQNVGHRHFLVRDSFVAHTMRFDDRHGGRDIVSCGAHDC